MKKKFEFELTSRETITKRSFVIIEAESEEEAYNKYEENSAEILLKCKWEDTTDERFGTEVEINEVRGIKN